MTDTNRTFRDATAKRRYELLIDDTLAGFAEYRDIDDRTREFPHTVIGESYRGQGLSSQLIRYALDQARAAGKTVVATCSAVAHFIDTHPDYAPLVATRSGQEGQER